MKLGLGYVGESRYEIRDSKGNLVREEGYVKNVILDKFLDVIGGAETYYRDCMDGCVVGTGTSVPTIEQVGLDAPVKSVGVLSSAKITEFKPVEGDIYRRTSREAVYRFTGLGNVNLTELGLTSRKDTLTGYNTTRALFKDSSGNNTTLSIKSDETLDIFYKIWLIHDLRDSTGTFNITDGDGVVTEYNYISRVSNALSNTSYGDRILAVGLFMDFTNDTNSNRQSSAGTGDIVGVEGKPGGIIYTQGVYKASQSTSAYVVGTYKKTVHFSMPLDKGNGNIRSMFLHSNAGQWQVRLGTVDGDLPFTKTNKDTAYLGLEVSWGRFVEETT